MHVLHGAPKGRREKELNSVVSLSKLADWPDIVYFSTFTPEFELPFPLDSKLERTAIATMLCLLPSLPFSIIFNPRL